jgi:ribosomal-protein-alanine N-acetyltransferase
LRATVARADRGSVPLSAELLYERHEVLAIRDDLADVARGMATGAARAYSRGMIPQLAPARMADAARIARLSRDWIENGLPWSWTPQRVAASVRRRDALVVVARAADATIAGFAIMRYGDDDAHLDLLGVCPGHRGHGLGGRLVEWLEKPALVAGIRSIRLEVRESNVAARRFYERLGYRVVQRLPGYYQGRESALRMGREIGVAVPALGLVSLGVYWAPEEAKP